MYYLYLVVRRYRHPRRYVVQLNVTVSAHPHSRHHFDTTSFGVVPTDVVMTAGQTQRFMNQNGTCVTGEQTTPIFLCTADTTAIRINGRFVAVNVYCTVFLRTNATVSIFTHCAMYHGSNGTFGSHSSDSTPNTTPNPNHTPKKPPAHKNTTISVPCRSTTQHSSDRVTYLLHPHRCSNCATRCNKSRSKSNSNTCRCP